MARITIKIDKIGRFDLSQPEIHVRQKNTRINLIFFDRMTLIIQDWNQIYVGIRNYMLY